MFILIKKLFNSENEWNWFWGMALLALFVEVCFHSLLPISISTDGHGYIGLSQRIGDPTVSWERGLGYPLLLKILGTNLLDNLIPVIWIQAAMSVLIPLIIFKSLVRFGLGYAILGALISCFYFYNFVISLYILTELMYVFSLAIYAYFLIRYFQNMTMKNLFLVIGACFLIDLIRLSGAQYFLALMLGIGCYTMNGYINKKHESSRLGMQHLFVAGVVVLSFSFVQGLVTNRVSSIIWPHFVFNWVYKSNEVAPIYYGIVKPQNGPAAKKLFHEVEKVVADNPLAFDLLKSGGTQKVQSLSPEENGQYSQTSIALLMRDLIYNNKHDVRSWWIEGVLTGTPRLGIVGTSHLLGAAIMEAFKTHPEVLLKRIILVLSLYWDAFIKKGVDGNNVSLPSAYHQQIPNVIMSDASMLSLKPGVYKQWAYDLYEHTGNDPLNRAFDYPNKFPMTFDGALVNVKSDNLIGLGHYVALLGMQVIRLCWLLIILGIVMFPFCKNKAMMTSFFCASIVPPLISVFVSEVDVRHLFMASPIQIVTAVLVIYSFRMLCKKTKKDVQGSQHAK